MKTYSGLRNVCALWMMLAVIGGALAVVAGVIMLGRGGVNGLYWMIGGALFFIAAFTLDRLIDLCIDIALHVQTLASRGESEASSNPSTQRIAPQFRKKSSD